jgi:muconate cycloisomerase
MKITHLETYPVRVPLKPERRMISSLGQHTVSEYLLVRLGTDAGIEGAGEATVMPRWSGETVWGAEALVQRVLAPLVIGCDPHDVAEIDRRMDAACAHNWFAKSAIEMACWDIQGKAAGKPIYELLGGARRPLTFRCRFSMGAYDPQRARRVTAERVAAGFTTIKVKVGKNVAEDVERVRIVREAIGPDLEIVIDANCGYDADTAIEAVRQMAPYRVSLFEQPTPDGDYQGIARVRRAIQPEVEVMADDMCFNLAHARELVRNQGCDCISVYPGKNGGIRKTIEIVDFAAAHGVACSIGSNLELDIATAAMGHVVVARQNMQVEKYPGDTLGPIYHEFSLVREPVRIEGPLVTVPDRPGLGVEVDWQLARQHRAQ